MEESIRIPRPLGSTQLARTYQETRDQNDLKKLRYLILKAFINQGLYTVITSKPNLYLKPTSNKKHNKESITKGTKDRGLYTNAPNDNQIVGKEVCLASFQQLANFLGLSETKCRERMMRLLGREAEATMSEEMESEAMSGLARVVIKEAFFSRLQQGLIHAEWGTELRTVARLNGYHPLQVKEANSAMATEISMAKQIWDMAKSMVPNMAKSGTNINLIQNNQPTTQNQYLTPTMAVQLIEDKGYNAIPQNGTQHLEQLALEHQIHNMPDVQAIGADAQGIVAPKVKDLAYIQHEDRREVELGIVDHQVE